MQNGLVNDVTVLKIEQQHSQFSDGPYFGGVMRLSIVNYASGMMFVLQSC
jgi:hypothetical protein